MAKGFLRVALEKVFSVFRRNPNSRVVVSAGRMQPEWSDHKLFREMLFTKLASAEAPREYITQPLEKSELLFWSVVFYTVIKSFFDRLFTLMLAPNYGITLLLG